MHQFNRVWILISRSLSNEASNGEKEELQVLLQQDKELQQQYGILQQFWEPAQPHHYNGEEQIEKLLKKARQKEEQSQIITDEPPAFKRPYLKMAWMAAAAVMLIVVFFWLYGNDSGKALAANFKYTDSIITQNGNRSQLILPDGSRVWLNSGSRLLYQKEFSGKMREVQLIGEAFFEVVKMPEKPFIVHAGGINIRVLGTTFNVKCYPKDEDVETTLLHGAVSVSHPSDPGKTTILLKPHEKLRVKKQLPVTGDNHISTLDKNFIIENLDTAVQPSRLPETAWVYNRLEFKNDDFGRLAEKMERWYNVKINFQNESMKQLRFIGSFENETIEEALTALQAVSKFRYKIKNNEILIKPSY